MASAKELYFSYPDERDKKNPGYCIPARGHLVVLRTEEEEKSARELGFVVTAINGHLVSNPTVKTMFVTGYSVEDEEIIPFPNRDSANKVAEKISLRS